MSVHPILIAAAAILIAAGHAVAAPTVPAPAISQAVRDAAKEMQAGRTAEGLARLDALAKAGDAGAGALLAEIYLLGLFDVPRDVRRGCDYADAFKDLHREATHNFAQCLFDGEGRAKDLAQARVWYRKALDAGFHQSGCALGNMYVHGWGGPAEPEKGLALCLAAAETGQRDAQTDVGNHYLFGRGTARDYGKAREWYLKAANQGQANAAFTLAQMQWNGDGGPVDRSEAARWWKVAYDKGRKDAALHLGNGELLQVIDQVQAKAAPDLATLDRAIAWFERAALAPQAEVREKAAKGLDVARELRNAVKK